MTFQGVQLVGTERKGYGQVTRELEGKHIIHYKLL